MLAGECRYRLGVARVWAVNTEHISIAHTRPGLNMKARDKSAADESNSESVHRWPPFSRR